MRLTALLMCIATLPLCARSFSQTVTLSGKDLTLETVFTRIHQQTGYEFIYIDGAFEKTPRVTLNVKDLPLTQVMDQCFANLPFKYVILQKTIVISEKVLRSSPPARDPDPAPGPDDDVMPISGQVLTSTGDPLAGATITNKRTGIGTVTDADGRFVTEVKAGDVLVVTYTGYVRQEIKIARQRQLDIRLAQAENKLDEIQIVAYGQTSRRLSTGNISTVKAQDIARQPVSNPLLALQGRVPGLFIEQGSGLPGTSLKIRIQGQNSLVQGSEPFYVVDGIPYMQQILRQLNFEPGNPFSFINPADIESIDVLKDADATSIYGSRAAAGAIIITTKKGKAGATRFDLNAQTGGGKVTRKMRLLNTQQYLAMRKEAYTNDGLAIPDATTTPDYSNYDLTTWDQQRNTDWQKELIGGTAKYHDVQLSVSGGNATTQFLVNGNFHRETSVFPSDLADQKTGMHFNLNNTSPNQRFRLQLDAQYMIDRNSMWLTDLTRTALTLAPNAPAIYNSDGSFNWEQLPNGVSTFDNPLAYFGNSYRQRTKNLVSNVFVSYRLLPGLDIKSTFGYTDLQADEVQTNPSTSFRPDYRMFYSGSSSFGNGSISSWNIEPQVTYKRPLLQGTLELLAGVTFFQTSSARMAFGASGFANDLLLENIGAASVVDVHAPIATTYKYNAIFGRMNYNLRDRYILNVTARRDGSSRFGPENLFNNFMSVAGAWLFTNEAFARKSLSFLSFGKIKASYGTTGNDQIGDYQFMSLYDTRNRPVPYQNQTGLYPIGLANPNLQWEETRKLSVGLDLGFISDRILLNVNYYRNRSSNQLQGYSLPIISGFNNILRNQGATIQNSGWELAINTTNVKTPSFIWTSAINLTIPRNKLVSYPGLESSSAAYSLTIGQPITSVKQFKYLGVDPQTGLYQVADKNGKPVEYPNYSDDRTILINTDPRLHMGFQNNISYKAFSLDLLFSYVSQKGVDYFYGNRPGTFFGYDGNQPLSVLDRWRSPGDKAPIRKFSTEAFPVDISNIGGSDASYSSASYVRLKNLSLSWQLPESWKAAAHLKSGRLFVQGQNLLTITSFKGMDPENRSIASIPPLRILTGGIQLNF